MDAANTTTLTIADQTDLELEMIDLAAKHLGATRYARDTIFGFTVKNRPGVVYLATEDDMIELGRRLAEDSDGVVSYWLAALPEHTTAKDLINLCPEWRTDGSLEDLAGLRASAGSAGDYLTCAAIDHLADDLLALVSEVQP